MKQCYLVSSCVASRLFFLFVKNMSLWTAFGFAPALVPPGERLQVFSRWRPSGAFQVKTCREHLRCFSWWPRPHFLISQSAAGGLMSSGSRLMPLSPFKTWANEWSQREWCWFGLSRNQGPQFKMSLDAFQNHQEEICTIQSVCSLPSVL